MRTISLAIVTVAMLVITACGAVKNSASGPATVTMTGDSFATSALTIAAGTTVTFTTQMTGATHFVTTGENGVHADEAGAPTSLASATGQEVDPGQSAAVTFTTPGTYHLTCTVHPGMTMTITVR